MNALHPGRNVVLVGLMGTGKSTVGRLVAARLRRPFVDTDAVVEAEAGRSVAELFAAEGERGFRARESETIRHVSALRGQVIAVGGGAVTTPDNRTQLRATGDVVWLDAPPEVLARRVAGQEGTRPLLNGGQDAQTALTALAAGREGDYRAAADTRIDTAGLTVEQTAAAVLEWAQQRAGLLAPGEVVA